VFEDQSSNGGRLLITFCVLPSHKFLIFKILGENRRAKQRKISDVREFYSRKKYHWFMKKLAFSPTLRAAFPESPHF
jgi:hypothetical protein